MKKFTDIITETYSLLSEQPDVPPQPAPPPPGPDAGGAPPSPDMGGMGDLGGMGQEQSDPTEEMDDGAKREADPIAYTENVLQQLVDPDAGITPEMFADFIDTFGVGLAKIKDKEGFQRFYGDFYNQLQQVMEVRDKMKSMFEQLHDTLRGVLSTQDRQEPDNAQGGAGRPGPSGPGVN